MPVQHFYYVSKTRRSDPGELATNIEEFAESLIERGYSHSAINKHISSVAHFGEWMSIHAVAVSDIDQGVIKRFSKHRCFCPSRMELTRFHRHFGYAETVLFLRYSTGVM